MGPPGRPMGTGPAGVMGRFFLVLFVEMKGLHRA
jgi:hypothetical protein